MSAPIYDFSVNAGAQWRPVFRWGTRVLTSVPITAITNAAPAKVTAVGHGLPDGWPAAVVSAGGMTQINSANFPPRGADWQPCTRVDVDNVKIDAVSSAGYTPYTLGGYLVYRTPVDLSGVLAVQLTVYDNPGHTGTPLATLAVGSGITLDNTAKTITAALATAGLTWVVGYYELLVTDSNSIPRELVNGTLSILP